MTIALTIRRQKYLPIRALPHVSASVLDALTVIEMVRYPEQFCDSQYDTILSPKVLRNGALMNASMQSFALMTSSGELPAGVLVLESAARAMYGLCRTEGINASTQERVIFHAWDTRVVLSKSERDYVFEALPVPRKNARTSTLAEIKAGYDNIAKICSSENYSLDPQHLPCTAATWLAIMERLNFICRAPSVATFKDHMKALGFRWRRGRNHIDDFRFTSLIDSHLAN